MMHQVYKTLPDDKPITSIHVVEDPQKCPAGFAVVSRTHDQDSDADLWREGPRVFGRRATRYVCLSKTLGIGDYIVESVVIINEKEAPPDGFSILTKTADTDQRAWRKRQLCYRLAKKSQAQSAITDIIILSRMKKAPEGFSLAGEINGVTVCIKVKIGPIYNGENISPPSLLLYSLAPTNSPNAENNQWHSTNGYVNQNSAHGITKDLGNMHLQPSRPAPKPPSENSGSHTWKFQTIAAYNGLEGVPFVLNPLLENLSTSQHFQYPTIKAKTKTELDKEFGYDFLVERQV